MPRSSNDQGATNESKTDNTRRSQKAQRHPADPDSNWVIPPDFTGLSPSGRVIYDLRYKVTGEKYKAFMAR